MDRRFLTQSAIERIRIGQHLRIEKMIKTQSRCGSV
jgi:hypothetical protein